MPVLRAADERGPGAPEGARPLRLLLAPPAPHVERARHRRRGTRLARAHGRSAHGPRLVARPRSGRPPRRQALPLRARTLAQRGAGGEAVRLLPRRRAPCGPRVPAARPAKALDRGPDRRRDQGLDEPDRLATEPRAVDTRGQEPPGRKHRLPGYGPVAASPRQGRGAERASSRKSTRSMKIRLDLNRATQHTAAPALASIDGGRSR
jgi:hypothetical protein